MRLQFTLTGVSPILMHNGPAGIDTRNPLSREIAAIAAKKGGDRTDVEDLRLQELECRRSLYLDADGKPTLPEAALRAMIEASCSASTTFAARVASFKDVTRHPQNDRTRCLGPIASRRHPRPGTAARRFTLDRKHAAARGVLRSRVRQSAASRESSWTAGTPPSKPGRKAHNCYRSRGAGGVLPVDAALDAALPTVGHLTMHHHCTRSPARHLPGRRAGGPVFGVFPGRYVTV